jgi:hypothetical protein
MQLRDNATPELVKALPSLDPRLRKQPEAELASRKRTSSDWRTWNVSRRRAQQALDELP